MELPKATSSQERIGISAVQAYAASRGQIWRETTTGDVGVDGQLEYVNKEGYATGRTIALQVKTGPSYFQHPSANGCKFYPEPKHRTYWEVFPLPVLLVLHDPASKVTYWADARQALRTPGQGEKAFIEVPRSNVLEQTEPTALFENAGVQDQAFIADLTGVLDKLVLTTSSNERFPVSYFDLFAQGLTNICRSIFYGIDVATDAARYNLHLDQPDVGISFGPPDQDFVFGFVKFLLAQNLAQVDYADCLIDWADRHMQPSFVAPLTSRGRKLVHLIQQEEQRLVKAGALPDESGLYVAQEGFFQMELQSYYRRLPRIRTFQHRVREHSKTESAQDD